MPRIAFSPNGSTLFEKLLGHNSEILARWCDLETAFFSSPNLDPEIREEVRRVLAHGNGCQYCMAKGAPAANHPEPRVALAMTFAQMMLDDHQAISDSNIAVLRTEFNDAEIAELCAFICFITAAQMFGAALNLQP